MNRQSPKGKLFSSGMDEDDVVMGRDEKVKEAIAELDCKYHPEVIAEMVWLLAFGCMYSNSHDFCYAG